MIVKSVPLLSVFAAGCLSGAVFIAFWRVESADVPPSGARERVMRSDTFRTVRQELELAILRAPNDDRSAPRVEPAAHAKNDDLGGEPPTEPGTSVADALTRLEDAYREGIDAARKNDTSNKAGTVSEAPPRELPVREETVAVADPAPSRVTVPRADERTQSDPQADVKTFARRDGAPPPYLYGGDVHQNVQVSNVHQGDVNNVQQDVNNVQQVVVLQYLQLLTISPHGELASPAHKAGRESKRHARSFSSRSVTDPYGPSRFRRAPPGLGHVERRH